MTPPARTDVCLVVEATGFGGAEVHTLGLIEQMLGQGLSVVLLEAQNQVYADHVARFGAGRFSYRQIPASATWLGFKRLYRWWLLLRRTGAPVVLVPRPSIFMGALSFHVLCRLVFRRTFAIQHSMAFPGTWRQTLDRHAASWFISTVFAVSESVKRTLVENYGYRATRIRTVRNGTSSRRFQRDEELGREFRRSLGIRDDAFVFGMTTRFTHEKGTDLALAAAALLARDGRESRFRLVLVGSGALEDELKSRSRELGLGHIAVFVSHMRDTRAALSGFDSILAPSRAEGLPLSLLEGMAAGCIPIVTRVGGMPEVVSGPALGWVVNPEDPAALCAAMRTVLDLGTEQRQQLRRAVTAHVGNNFESSRSYGRIIESMLE